ncbi:hypothetical protein M406DRAFT_71243 [Cryphonectria parasitica EP155]|uniref:Rhodopsin domain-containing protein n=1 Tax=Cryphonectria parasitica (strain ATCC 38755 / EP155) TaxID=660469 RepID=A0A9P5CNR1_CRYP1|nr:uncharacterized protein M406DRAFT_71243 [Cryphonectria parasitica EP155]KAF3764195.1 hypothetical protein M406DRAFT_71243 [Cryphonectria parasitica EP155]
MAYTGNIIGAMVTFIIVNLIAVSMRMYVRLWLVKAFGLDDFFLLLSFLGYITACIMGFVSIHYGFAEDVYRPWFDYGVMMKFYWANQLMLYISSGLVKIAVALVLYRLACNLKNQAILVISIIVVIIWTFLTTIFSSDVCAETTGATSYAGDQTCTDVGYFRMISNIVIDFFFALYPIPMLWNSTLSQRMKYIVCGLLSLGLIASAATIAKLIILVQLQFATPDELPFLHYQLLVWADVELGLSILAASAAALRPLVRILTGHTSSGQFSSSRTPAGFHAAAVAAAAADQEAARRALHPDEEQPKQQQQQHGMMPFGPVRPPPAVVAGGGKGPGGIGGFLPSEEHEMHSLPLYHRGGDDGDLEAGEHDRQLSPGPLVAHSDTTLVTA